jgi:hypothetical protein
MATRRQITQLDEEDADNNGRRGYRSGGRLVPVPDPTALTTDQLRREISALREVVMIRIDGVESNAMTLKETLNNRKEEIDASALALRELLKSEINKLAIVTDEKFSGVSNQFIERDKRTDQLTVAAQTAVTAAFAAQKEAVSEQNKSNSLAINKSEQATAESLRQLQTLFISDSKATNDKIDDLKGRLDRGEGHGKGVSDFTGWIFGAVGMVVGVVALIALLTKHVP